MRLPISIFGFIVATFASRMDFVSNPVSPESIDKDVCSEAFGKPAKSNCETALNRFLALDPSPGSPESRIPQYLRHSSAPLRSNAYNGKLPVLSAWDDCFVTLNIGRKLGRDLPQIEWWDDASWEDIRSAGRKIIDDCLAGGPEEAVGGIMSIGQRKKLDLIMFGPGFIGFDPDHHFEGLHVGDITDKGVTGEIHNGLRMGSQSSIFMEAKLCWMGGQSHYIDDVVLQSKEKALGAIAQMVTYGISAMQSISVCS